MSEKKYLGLLAIIGLILVLGILIPAVLQAHRVYKRNQVLNFGDDRGDTEGVDCDVTGVKVMELDFEAADVNWWDGTAAREIEFLSNSLEVIAIGEEKPDITIE